MRKVEFVPFRLTEEVDIYSIRIDGKHETEFHEFLITFKGNNDPYLADDLERILRTLSRISAEGLSDSLFRPEGKLEDRVLTLQEIDKELRRLEDRGTDLYNEINNLTINIYGKGILQ